MNSQWRLYYLEELTLLPVFVSVYLTNGQRERQVNKSVYLSFSGVSRGLESNLFILS